jgi:hypothetical protein
MILSHAHKFLFIKTRKVASTSIEIALSKHCGPDDIITPVSPKDEIFRYQMGVLPRNYAADPSAERTYAEAVASGDMGRIESVYWDMHPRLTFWNHIGAKEIHDRVGDAVWNRVCKFSVIRHPYDYVVSMAYFRLTGRTKPSMIARWRMLADVIRHAPRNIDLLSIDGRIAIDKVLRYENLPGELTQLAGSIGVDISDQLPRAKADSRPRSATVDSVLDPFSRWLIRRRWMQEFEMFSYSS